MPHENTQAGNKMAYPDTCSLKINWINNFAYVIFLLFNMVCIFTSLKVEIDASCENLVFKHCLLHM